MALKLSKRTLSFLSPPASYNTDHSAEGVSPEKWSPWRDYCAKWGFPETLPTINAYVLVVGRGVCKNLRIPPILYITASLCMTQLLIGSQCDGV